MENEDKPAGEDSKAAIDLTERVAFLEAEAKKAFEKRDVLKEENRKLQEALAQIERDKAEKNKDKARSAKDIEALETSWKAELTKMEQEKLELETRVKNLVLDQQVSKVASNYLSPKGTEAFLALHKDKIQIVQGDDGSLMPSFTNDVRPIEKVIQSWAEDFPGFKPNNLKAGTSSQGNKHSGNVSYTRDQLLNMDRASLDRLYQSNPQVIRDALDGKI